MELTKKIIHMNHTKGKIELVATIDDDFIVPDVKPDILRKIKETGNCTIDKVKPMDSRVAVGGHLKYRLLYQAENGCYCMEGDIPFEETGTMEGVTAQDIVKCCGFVEDVSVTIINSRKISVKAVIQLEVTAECMTDMNAVDKLELDKLQYISQKMDVMHLVTSKKDIFRIRESVNLPSDYINIGEIKWYELEIRDMDMRACDGEIAIKGELVLLCIYTGEGDNEKDNYYTDTISFTGKTQVTGCTEEMIPDIRVGISDRSLIARADANGEMRILDGEVILDLDIKGYTENSYDILKDVYSPAYTLEPVVEDTEYESFVMRNSVKCRVEEHFKLPVSNSASIVNSSCVINIEDIVQKEDSLEVEGVVIADVLYRTNEDNSEFGASRYELPFSQELETGKIDENCFFTGKPGSIQITATLSGPGEITIKGNAGVEIMVMKKHHDKIITDIVVKDPDMDRIKSLPGITGYIVKEGDSLWNIAKKYCTTIDDIVRVNGLDSQEINPGMKLLVIKNC